MFREAKNVTTKLHEMTKCRPSRGFYVYFSIVDANIAYLAFLGPKLKYRKDNWHVVIF